MAYAIVLDLFLQCGFDLWPFRPWTDQAHFALQNGNQLRQLIDAQPSQQISHQGDPRIITAGPAWSPRFCFLTHSSQLPDLDGLSVEARAPLAVEDAPPAFEADGEGGDQQDRRRDDQQQAGDDQVPQAFEPPAPAIGLQFEAVGLQQPSA